MKVSPVLLLHWEVSLPFLLLPPLEVLLELNLSLDRVSWSSGSEAVIQSVQSLEMDDVTSLLVGDVSQVYEW